jgi:hypothetical protein
VAGSPAHAQVADVALGLDGPILAGESRRVFYNRDHNEFDLSDDATNFSGVNGLGEVMGLMKGLPGLVGFWPMSSVQRSSGAAYDLGGQGRTLTYNGNPTYNIYNDLVPYLDFDGTGDFLSRADETDLDILGTEAIFAAAVRGLTMGGWFWGDIFTSGTGEGLMGKLTNSTGTFAYSLAHTAANTLTARISSNGTSFGTTISSSVAVQDSTWYFLVQRFIPSTELSIFVGETKTTNSTSIPASIFNSSEAFAIGGIGGTVPAAPFNGRAALCFLCANALPDAMIERLFRRSRWLFGV